MPKTKFAGVELEKAPVCHRCAQLEEMAKQHMMARTLVGAIQDRA